MKKMSVKLKITLWFALFMVLLCAAMLIFIGFVSNSATTHENRNTLTRFIDQNADELDSEDGQLEIDDDFVFFQDGMYCLIFQENGTLVSGYAPYASLETEALSDGSLRSVSVGQESYLIYDRLISLDSQMKLWLRGVTPEGSGTIRSSSVFYAALIALPLLLLLAVGGGYLMAGRSLRPIQEIRRTAEEIGNSGDLSKRIEIGKQAGTSKQAKKSSTGDELQQLAMTFNQMFDRLQQNFEAEQRFTADASHELRTPVATILAQCEYAFENASGEQALYEAIGAIQKQGYRMNRLIESMLLFTRMEQQTEAPSFRPLDLSALVSSICQERKDAGIRGITLTEEIQPDIQLCADAGLFTRMLENLIQNAYKYGREDGFIKVSLKKENGREGSRIILTVEDNGIGIPPEELPKIWNRFYRVDKARSTQGIPGLGLGLAMVRQIARLHGGSVCADSIPGAGSRFTVSFP